MTLETINFLVGMLPLFVMLGFCGIAWVYYELKGRNKKKRE